ncbi:Crp/Fnr family transcriptional regulator [Mastigocoleus testarum]|uniref:Crp/Fnr family transcriptional regulator n=1 Tax=Mastigocoleus testarum BC008 TaxID=371196 RepID=A0A0V7ZDB6_9CYAN|nr:Crp/Fnr family transcriptional regulator [Mastigocoleus testarum]KST62380.1 Crp/Fnr family transcriptional regulator [Mastigocoleus testarum BC008]
MSKNSPTSNNLLLAALPSEDYKYLIPHLDEVSFTIGKVLHPPGEPIKDVYFPIHGMISLISIMEDGSTTEIALVGNEGMIGMPIFWGGNYSNNCAVVQLEGNGWKLNANIFKQKFLRSEALQKRLLLYTQALITQVSQNAACNRQHTIEERLCRWLLSVCDCIGKDNFPLTQEFISQMLGIRRSSVTVAAGTLQKAGLIRYNRGNINIINVKDLEAAACECYCVVKQEYDRLLG